MEFKKIIQSLKKGEYFPVYFLHGQEAFYIDEIVKYIEEKVLSESEKSFNQTILYGKEIDYKNVLDAARRYPIMADKQVVIIKEAQAMRTLDKLETYFGQPLESTILVLAHKHKKLDKRKKYGKALTKAAKAGKICLFESNPLYDNQVPNWIENYLKEFKIKIQPSATQLLSEYLGNDLAKIANELDKLRINLPEGQKIDKNIIQKNIGISKDFNVFELQSALAKRDVTKVHLIMNYFISNPKNNPLIQIVSTLYNYFSKVYICKFLPNLEDNTIASNLKINRYFASDYRTAAKSYSREQVENTLRALKDCDLRCKGVHVAIADDMYNERTSHGELLKELISSILA